ncbi:CotS family spore coat protein [Clostridium brassicae]|uniref:CotS family spore coat protein n=1 Tax=Clostridium brassicae TaxID=2999072 RepID=A0ABT4D8V3_9CLOT|nr:CotS family spore coat protein [Clostridium brassicae]MCY6958738.1 CotS family spore coat protein [Clostridium brassicae]
MLHNVRYKDKKALVEYDLNIDILKEYDLKVEDLIPVRNVFILVTSEGDKILKKINYEIDELKFINDGIEYIRRNGFNRIFRFVRTRDNKIYVKHNKNVYCLMDLIDGRESEYTNPIDVGIASRGIGELHRACEGFKCKNRDRYACGNLLENFKRKLHEMDLFKNLALLAQDKTEFDEIFLHELDDYKIQMENSISILENSSFYKLCSEEDKKVLCHHDLAHHNILIKDDEAYFIDFDYSIIDLKVHDLCNFINKVGKKTGYDIEKAENIIKNYNMVNKLDKNELEVLYGMLVFPYDFYDISKNYYTRTKNWDYNTFLQKIIRKNDFKDDREEFLRKFSDIII